MPRPFFSRDRHNRGIDDQQDQSRDDYTGNRNWYDITNTDADTTDGDDDDDFNQTLNNRRYRRESYNGHNYEYVDDNDNDGEKDEYPLREQLRGFGYWPPDTNYEREDWEYGLNESDDENDEHMPPARGGPKKRAVVFDDDGGIGGSSEDDGDDEDDDDEKARAFGGYQTDMPAKGVRVLSGPFLEEGHNPDMQVRHRVVSGSGMMGPGLNDGKEGDWVGGGRGGGGGGGDTDTGSLNYGGPKRLFWTKKKKWLAIGICALVVVLAIVIPVAVVFSRRKHHASEKPKSPYNSALDRLDPNTIPVLLLQP